MVGGSVSNAAEMWGWIVMVVMLQLARLVVELVSLVVQLMGRGGGNVVSWRDKMVNWEQSGCWR